VGEIIPGQDLGPTGNLVTPERTRKITVGNLSLRSHDPLGQTGLKFQINHHPSSAVAVFPRTAIAGLLLNRKNPNHGYCPAKDRPNTKLCLTQTAHADQGIQLVSGFPTNPPTNLTRTFRSQTIQTTTRTSIPRPAKGQAPPGIAVNSAPHSNPKNCRCPSIHIPIQPILIPRNPSKKTKIS
jgi:hypothetical protein